MRGNTVFRSCQKLIGKLIYYRLGTFAVIRSWPFPRRPNWWEPTTAPAPPLETPPLAPTPTLTEAPAPPPVTTDSTPTPLPASCPSPPPTPPATSSTPPPPTLTMALAQPLPWGEVLEEEQEIFIRQTRCNNNNIYKGGPVDDNEVEDIEVFPCEQCDYKSKKRSNLKRHKESIHKTGNKSNYTGEPVNDNTDIEVYNCGQCDYKSKKRSNVKRHEESMHKTGNKLDYLWFMSYLRICDSF